MNQLNNVQMGCHSKVDTIGVTLTSFLREKRFKTIFKQLLLYKQ